MCGTASASYLPIGKLVVLHVWKSSEITPSSGWLGNFPRISASTAAVTGHHIGVHRSIRSAMSDTERQTATVASADPGLIRRIAPVLALALLALLVAEYLLGNTSIAGLTDIWIIAPIVRRRSDPHPGGGASDGARVADDRYPGISTRHLAGRTHRLLAIQPEFPG